MGEIHRDCGMCDSDEVVVNVRRGASRMVLSFWFEERLG